MDGQIRLTHKIYQGEIEIKWKRDNNPYDKLKEIYVLNNLIFLDNKSIIQKSEEDLKILLFGFRGSVNISTCAYLQRDGL